MKPVKISTFLDSNWHYERIFLIGTNFLKNYWTERWRKQKVVLPIWYSDKKMHPSFFRGVKLKLSDHGKSQWGVVVGPLEAPKHPRNKSFMERNFTSGYLLSAIGLEPAHDFITKFEAGRLIHLATVSKASQAKNLVNSLSYLDVALEFWKNTIGTHEMSHRLMYVGT